MSYIGFRILYGVARAQSYFSQRSHIAEILFANINFSITSSSA